MACCWESCLQSSRCPDRDSGIAQALSNVGLDSIEVLQHKAQGDSIRVPGGVTQRCSQLPWCRRQTGETYYPTLKRHRHVQVIQLKHLGGICLSLHRNTLMRSECWVAGWCDQCYRSSATCPKQLCVCTSTCLGGLLCVHSAEFAQARKVS